MKIEANNLYLGDCYKLIKDIPDKSIDLIITDPPYEIQGLSSKPHGLFNKNGHTRKYEQEMLKTNLGDGVDMAILDDFVRVLKKINIYIWCNKEQIYDYLHYFVKEKKCNWEMFIRVKSNVPPFTSGHFLKDKEYCLYFWERGVKINPTYEGGKTFYYSTINTQDKELYDHPTIKPIELVKRHIRNSTKENDVVLDCFSGSSTTLCAAKELGRRYIGFEIDPNYYQIGIDRLNGITQKERKQNIEQMKLF